MNDWRTEIYAVNLDFRRYSRGITGICRFETLAGDGTWQSILDVKKGWCADYVVNQASGLPEVQIEIADQLNLTELLKGNSIQAVFVEGVRYERRDQDLLLGVPRVWRLRCQPISGDAEIEAALMRRVNQGYIQ